MKVTENECLENFSECNSCKKISILVVVLTQKYARYMIDSIIKCNNLRKVGKGSLAVKFMEEMIIEDKINYLIHQLLSKLFYMSMLGLPQG